ncbi:SNF7 (YLR025W) [Zygosaccharomyces parabailii]|nr:SNF7 (YLR025W) [Zygosaccharomyces parabailii]CDH16058.1 probable Vacuolar-sorting protein SNF7 [Zygosaccharomyces bailii ISA1307]SJM83101.1 probable Vacuolar-sorting protein SNF7 [Zygosaccharomyces bailii]
MWSYIFGGSSSGSSRSNRDLPKKAIVELREHINLLSKKQSHLQTQILNQENEAKTFLTKGNKSMAKNSLKKKKIYEAQLVKLEGQMDSLEQQLFSIESANLNLETMRAMKQGAKAMKSMHNGLDIDKVDETMDEVREQVELGEEISDAISRPMYTGINEVDDDELDEELDALAHQDQVKEPAAAMLQPATPEAVGKHTVSLPNAPNSKIEPSRAQANQAEEEEEDEDERALKELQAEMGL